MGIKKTKQIETKNIRNVLKHGKSTSSKSVVIYSDGHIGSTLAPCTEEPTVINSGGYFRPRKRNKLLYEFLTTCYEQFRNGSTPYINVFNGEPVDGPDNKGRGKETWSNDMYDQCVDSVKILKKLKVQNNNWFFTTGSGYHVNLNGTTPIEEFIAREMNARKFNMYDDENFDRYTDNILQFSLHDRVFNIAHPITGSLNFMYRATPLAREMFLLSLEAGRGYPKDEVPNIVVRSHTHHYTHVAYKHSYGWVTAGLQLTNRFQLNKGIAGKFNDIGVLEIIVEPNGRVEYNQINAPEKITQINTFKM